MWNSIFQKFFRNLFKSKFFIETPGIGQCAGIICLNGPAARKCAVGDVIIIISYASMDFEEAKSHKPTLVFPDTATNKLI